MKASVILLACTTAMASFTASYAATTINPGDISIIAFQSDDPDSLAFVTWVDIDNAVSLSFWDSGYIGGGDGSGTGVGGGDWRETEDELVWFNDSGSSILAGTVITISANVADLGTTSGSLTGLSTSGDQIFAGQGSFSPGGNPSTYSGVLSFGINFDGASWAAASTSSNTSGLPGDLNTPDGNFAIAEADSGQYTGLRSFASIAVAKTAVLDAANWSTSNDAITIDGTDFSITPIPEPASLAMLGLCVGMFAFLRRRR